MFNFYPLKTSDGTISLFNTSINDVYHSDIGAHVESLKKFVIPSNLIEFAKLNNEIKILDVCFGLGYNSKVAINEILKVNPDCKIKITALEMDEDVINFSGLTSFEGCNAKINYAFYLLLKEQNNLDQFIEKLKNSQQYNDFIEEFNKNAVLFNSFSIDTSSSLHNIYYRTVSNRYKDIKSIVLKMDFLELEIYTCDARQAVSLINDQYDFIFQDPFTPSRQPLLWTVEFLSELFRLLSNNGNLTTYTSSSPVRAGLIEAGFSIGTTDAIGRKFPGTIATKNPDLITKPLNIYEKEILKTNAGIPYSDPYLNLNSDEILKERELYQKNSGRLTTSQFFKVNKYLKNNSSF